MRLLGVALLMLAAVAVAMAFPTMWNDATTLDRISYVFSDGAIALIAAAICAIAGAWILYRAAHSDMARLSLALGVGCGFVTVALLVNAAESGFFAVGYNPLGILLIVLGGIGTLLGIVKSFDSGAPH